MIEWQILFKTIELVVYLPNEVIQKILSQLGFEATFWQKKLDWNQLTFGDMIDPIRGLVYQTEIYLGGSKSGLDYLLVSRF